MDKLKMHSLNKVDDNIAKIGQLFPNCLTERKNEKGEVEYAIDFDVLRQELSSVIVEGNEERYQFTWPDKKKSILLANAPIAKTLRPCPEESVDFETTENLYIEGDNLDVLKLLQETYLGKVKMIYIDPPYNTGNDFVYEDDFAQSTDEYLANSGQYDEEGNRLAQNNESNGRFHTDWLNMIYPRLKVAKDLLTEDGVIFISIDDNEVHNLRKVCDEVFGVGNFIDIFSWSKTETPPNLSKKSKKIIEYILCYQKSRNDIKFTGLQKVSQSSNGLLNQPNSIGVLKFPANIVRTNIPDGIITKGMYGTDSYSVELLDDTEVKNNSFVKPVLLKAKFKWGQEYLDNEIKKGTIINIPTIKLSPSYEKLEYDAEVPPNLINSKVGVGTNENAGADLISLMGKKIFDYPKPVSLLKYILKFNDDQNGIFLDFFSGSATLAEAIFDLNSSEENSKRKFICVQIPEKIEIIAGDNEDQKKVKQNAIDFLSEMNKPNLITEIGKERIRRAGKKIHEEQVAKDKGLFDGKKPKLDIGFRVLKLDSTNMKEVYYNPSEYTPELFSSLTDNIKEDRTPEDLLFQVMLELGVLLSSKIEKTVVNGKTVFNVAEGYLIACFDDNINDDTVKAIAQQKPYYAVFRDSSMVSDSVATNIEQIFATFSPTTERKVI